MEYSLIIPLLTGFITDIFIGDPYRLPHPVRWFGMAIFICEKKLNKGKNRMIKGAVSAISLILIVYMLFYLIERLLNNYPSAYLIFSSLFVFYGFAGRSLITEALKTEKALSEKGLNAARRQLSCIVGRDTSNLSAGQIRAAVLETLAENLSDGVVAPMFYYFIGGVPLMMAYKMVNTLDSMIGYKNSRYIKFGMFAARIDDIFNFVPARITALLMVLSTFRKRGVQFIFKYGHKNPSPNAGYPEAALAGILNCRLGGPNIYHGIHINKPYIGINERDITSEDIRVACLINFSVSVLLLMLEIAFFIIM